jgi:uncharacterized protein
MSNKNIYYNIYSEFYNVNKYRELKSMSHHGNNRLDHINRVSKMSFYISKRFGLDYVSCTRGALLHDFFTVEDISRSDKKYNDFLHEHPRISLTNSKKYFKLNEIEEDIILTHMFPIVKGKPKYIESKVVCICDKLVSFYEFFRYQLSFSFNLLLILFLK